MFQNMEKWVEIRRKGLANEASKRAICLEYHIHWDTLQRIFDRLQSAHGYEGGCTGVKDVDRVDYPTDGSTGGTAVGPEAKRRRGGKREEGQDGTGQEGE